MLNLSLFVLAALFLMDQGLLTTLEVVLGAVIVLLAFIALNDDSNDDGDGRLRTLGVLGIGALPLLVVLFLRECFDRVLTAQSLACLKTRL